MGDIYNPGSTSDLFQAPEPSDVSRFHDIKENAKKKLRTLRTLLVVWVLSFVIAMFWLTFSGL